MSKKISMLIFLFLFAGKVFSQDKPGVKKSENKNQERSIQNRKSEMNFSDNEINSSVHASNSSSSSHNRISSNRITKDKQSSNNPGAKAGNRNQSSLIKTDTNK